jgi:hypothetical protein
MISITPEAFPRGSGKIAAGFPDATVAPISFNALAVCLLHYTGGFRYDHRNLVLP